jgi:cytochrome b subunit of formate dehydrogenase
LGESELKIDATTRYWLAVILAIIAVVLAISSLLLWVIFPRGYFPGRVVWVEIHKWTGLAIAVGILFHIAIHWKWLAQMTRRYIDKLFNRESRSRRKQ